MNYFILNYALNVQLIWWITCSLVFSKPFEFYLLGFSLGCLIFKVAFKCLNLKQKVLVKSLLCLIHLCLYCEANLRIPMNNPFSNHANSIIIIANYQSSLSSFNEQNILITKLGFPIYALLRILSMAFIKQDYTIIESCIIVFCYIGSILYNELQKSKQKSDKKQLVESDKHNFNKLLTFYQQDSKKQSLGASFKKSRTHYSCYQEKPDVFAAIPIFNEPKTMEENLKGSVSKMKKSFTYQKYSIGSIDMRQDGQPTFFQNVFNLFSSGILIINQQKKKTFMNNKCEKIFGSKDFENVLDFIKSIIINTAKNSDDDFQMYTPPYHKMTMNRSNLERLIRYYQQTGKELDIYNALMFPQSYLSQLYQNVSPNLEQDQKSSFSGSQNETYFQQEAIIYEHIISDKINGDKKIKIVLIPTQITAAQQDQLSQPSQQKVPLTKQQNVVQEQYIYNQILLIKIKNITKKHKIEQMNREKEIHNSLLQSFSHELKTPLNSAQDMLCILKDTIKDQQPLEHLEIAHISILFLIHQINDILDYAAMQSNKFFYKPSVFKMEEIIEEIQYIYQKQMSSKQIIFDIKFSDKLKSLTVKSDKQRIIQVLINLLNNSCKFTKEGGRIVLSGKIDETPFIKLQVKDNGVGIQTDQLNILKKVLTSSMGKSLHRSRIRRNLGVGLNISARIVEGLKLTNDGQLYIDSPEQNGTKIYFFVENQLLFRDESVRNPMVSEYTTKNNTYKQQMSYGEGSQYSQDLPLLRQLSDNSSKFAIDQQSKRSKSHQKSRFSNLIPAIAESSLEMSDLFNYEIDVPVSPEYFKKVPGFNAKQLSSQITKCPSCTSCIKVLIVDDVPFNQIALKALLQHYSINADQAYDGAQAISLVKKQSLKHCQYYSLIFMDIEMPGMNGIQASKEILELNSNQTNIIICSAYDTEENQRDCENIGITEFLPKPVNQRDLERILQKFGFL